MHKVPGKLRWKPVRFASELEFSISRILTTGGKNDVPPLGGGLAHIQFVLNRARGIDVFIGLASIDRDRYGDSEYNTMASTGADTPDDVSKSSRSGVRTQLLRSGAVPHFRPPFTYRFGDNAGVGLTTVHTPSYVGPEGRHLPVRA